MIKALLMCVFALVAGIALYAGFGMLFAGEAGSAIYLAVGAGSAFLFAVTAQA